jgi:hypothetical protein
LKRVVQSWRSEGLCGKRARSERKKKRGKGTKRNEE